MYKIKVKKTGLGWKVLLIKKWWVLWITDTVSVIAFGYEYKVDEQINEWVEHFKIPHEMVSVPNGA